MRCSAERITSTKGTRGREAAGQSLVYNTIILYIILNPALLFKTRLRKAGDEIVAAVVSGFIKYCLFIWHNNLLTSGDEALAEAMTMVVTNSSTGGSFRVQNSTSTSAIHGC